MNVSDCVAIRSCLLSLRIRLRGIVLSPFQRYCAMLQRHPSLLCLARNPASRPICMHSAWFGLMHCSVASRGRIAIDWTSMVGRRLTNKSPSSFQPTAPSRSPVVSVIWSPRIRAVGFAMSANSRKRSNPWKEHALRESIKNKWWLRQRSQSLQPKQNSRALPLPSLRLP